MQKTFENLFPMTPAQSWLFIITIMLIAVLVTYIIWYLDIVAQLAVWNCRLVGARGILYAFKGEECLAILQEKVIEVVPSEIGYRATTSDGETNYRYHIIVSHEDAGNPDYDEAIELAGGDQMLKDALLPISRVKNYFSLRNKETDETLDFFVVYVKKDNPQEIEDALNRLFKQEYLDALREARHPKKAA